MSIVNIIIPSVGESVTEVTVGEWLKKEGDLVKKGQDILCIDTEKASVEISADVSGKLSILKKTGETVTVGDVVGSIDSSASQEEGKQPEIKKEETKSNTSTINKKPKSVDTPKTVKTDNVGIPKSDLQNLSPAVRHEVLSKNIDIGSIKGSGKSGRVLKEDLTKKASSSADTKVQSSERKVVKPMSSIRKTIATRLKGVQQTSAILTTFNEADLTVLMSLRSKYQDEFIKKHGIKLGLMSIFIKACIESLKSFPIVNAFVEDNNIIYNNYYNIGVAVSTDNGLLVPVIKDADQMTLAELELKIKDFAEKARDKKISLDDLSGGTFTITNGGVFGSMLSTPILNAPQSGILGMHSIIERPVVIDSKIKARKMMYLALSYDHRIVDGREAVGFLVNIKQSIEDPRRLLLNL